MEEPTEPIGIRTVQPDDIDALCAISLETGHLGADASAQYRDPRLIGLIYAAPYAALSPETCLVAEDCRGVVGFAFGAHDTRRFEHLLETSWWPRLRSLHPAPEGDPATWDADQRRHHMMHHPTSAPGCVVAAFPAHMHVNIRPRAQGRGLGRALVKDWLSRAHDQGVAGVHIASNPGNVAARAFWTAMHFEPLCSMMDLGATRHVWMGRSNLL